MTTQNKIEKMEIENNLVVEIRNDVLIVTNKKTFETSRYEIESQEYECRMLEALAFVEGVVNKMTMQNKTQEELKELLEELEKNGLSYYYKDIEELKGQEDIMEYYNNAEDQANVAFGTCERTGESASVLGFGGCNATSCKVYYVINTEGSIEKIDNYKEAIETFEAIKEERELWD